MTITVKLTNLQWTAFCSLVADRMSDPDPERTREWIRVNENETVFVDDLMTLLMDAELASMHD